LSFRHGGVYPQQRGTGCGDSDARRLGLQIGLQCVAGLDRDVTDEHRAARADGIAVDDGRGMDLNHVTGDDRVAGRRTGPCAIAERHPEATWVGAAQPSAPARRIAYSAWQRPDAPVARHGLRRPRPPCRCQRPGRPAEPLQLVWVLQHPQA